MATAVLRPNSTDTNQWFLGNHTDVDEVVLDPNPGTGGTDIWVGAGFIGDNNQIIVMGFPTIADIGEVTNIQVKTYGMRDTGIPEVDVNMGGWQGEVNVSAMGVNPNFSWGTNNFAGSWDQADLDGLQVRYRADCPSPQANTLDVVYVVVTYTLTPTGYAHDYMGVPAANIGSVNGVPTANIGNIKGV